METNTKNYAVIRIDLGHIEQATSIEDAEKKEFDGDVNWGYETSLHIPKEEENQEEYNFWANLTIDKIVEMRQKISSLEEKLSRSITWGVDDFEHKAEEIENYWHNDAKCVMFDRSKLHKALDTMIRKHDCNNGITWETIGFYLDEYCQTDFHKAYYDKYGWLEVSIEQIPELWDKFAIFYHDAHNDIQGQLNFSEDSKIDLEELKKYDILFIETRNDENYSRKN